MDAKTPSAETTDQPRAFALSQNSGGAPIHGLLQTPGAHPGPRPTVVVCHGFKGFMEWSFFPSLCELLAARGMTVVRFNFTGTGMRPGDELVTDPAVFRANTFSREQEEIQRVLEAVGHELGEGRIDRNRIALLGHSRGGGGAILASAHPDWHDRLRALVTWNAVATFDRMDLATRERWRRDGFLPLKNARTGQDLELGLELLEDLENHPAELDIAAAAANRRAPWLIVHGDADETVDKSDALELERHATAPCELLMIPDGSHTFGARHPFVGPTAELIQAMNATQRWLRRHL